MEKRIRVKAPLRMDLMGGSLDLSPLKEALLLSREKPVTSLVTCQLFVGCELKSRQDDQRILRHQNTLKEETYESSSDPSLKLLKNLVRAFFHREKGYELSIWSDVDQGSGLGASSALLLCILKSFRLWFPDESWSVLDYIRYSQAFESGFLSTVAGWQDYIAPLEGGALSIEWNWTNWDLQMSKYPCDFFEKHVFSIFSGSSHVSSHSNQILLNKINERRDEIWPILVSLCRLSHLFFEDFYQLGRASWGTFWDLDWELRDQLGVGFVTPELTDLKKELLSKGCQGVKICGAGAGGTILGWVEKEEDFENVLMAIQDMKPIPLKLSSGGLSEEVDFD
jgi:galactokinase/mevalonate kinase-like predicted kinase